MPTASVSKKKPTKAKAACRPSANAPRTPKRQMTVELARSRAIAGREDAPPFDGVAFLRSLR